MNTWDDKKNALAVLYHEIQDRQEDIKNPR